MPLNYDKNDAKSLALPKGPYEATLSFVKDTVAKNSGAEMQQWTFTVYHSDGKDRKVFLNVTARMAFMIKKLAKAFGKLAEFEQNQFQADDHIGKNVRLQLRFVDDPQWGEKNEIEDILPLAGTPKQVPQRRPGNSEGPEIDDSDIPEFP